MEKIKPVITPSSTGRTFYYELDAVDDYCEFVPDEPNGPDEPADKELFDSRFGLSFLLTPADAGEIYCQGHMGDREDGNVSGDLSTGGWFDMQIGALGLVDEVTGGSIVAPFERLRFTCKSAGGARVRVRTGRSPIGLPHGA